MDYENNKNFRPAFFNFFFFDSITEFSTLFDKFSCITVCFCRKYGAYANAYNVFLVRVELAIREEFRLYIRFD